MPLYVVATPIGNLGDLTAPAREVLASCDGPGPGAAIAAVSVSGFPEGRFHFAGLLPRKASQRAAMLAELAALRAQLVFYEAPQRLTRTLADLRSALGDRPAVVARELTKLHEELARGTLAELEQRFAGEVRGEVVIVVRGAPEAGPEDPAALDEEIRARLARGEGPKAIAEALSGTRSKRDAYQRALELKRDGGKEGVSVFQACSRLLGDTQE